MICSEGISKLNTNTGFSSDIMAFSTKFIAKVVLPIEGRAATIIKSEGCRPLVFLSKSVKPVVTPVTSLLVLTKTSRRSMVLPNTASTSRGPSFSPVRRSAISNTLLSAKSRMSALSRPSGLYPTSAISWATPISSRVIARSLIICAYDTTFAELGVFLASSPR